MWYESIGQFYKNETVFSIDKVDLNSIAFYTLSFPNLNSCIKVHVEDYVNKYSSTYCFGLFAHG